MYFRHSVEPACGKAKHICYDFFKVCVRACMCVRASVRPSGFIRAITPSFMHEFQNYLTQVLNLKRKSAI